MDVKHHHPTWDDYLTRLQAAPRDGDHCGAETGENRTAWTGTENIKEADNLFKNGWPEGEAFVAEMSGKIQAQVYGGQSFAEEMRWDVVGNEYDICRAIDGEPDCGMNFTESEDLKNGGNRVVQVWFNMFASYGVTVDDMKRRGAAVAALVDVLESRGIRVELVLGCALSDGGKGHWQMTAMLKQAHDPVDMGRLAFVLAHPSMFRRIHFWYTAGEKDVEVKQFFGIGCNKGEGSPAKLVGYPENAIVVPEMEWKTESASAAWVIKSLEQFGIVVENA